MSTKSVLFPILVLSTTLQGMHPVGFIDTCMTAISLYQTADAVQRIAFNNPAPSNNLFSMINPIVQPYQISQMLSPGGDIYRNSLTLIMNRDQIVRLQSDHFKNLVNIFHFIATPHITPTQELITQLTFWLILPGPSSSNESFNFKMQNIIDSRAQVASLLFDCRGNIDYREQ